MDKKDLITSSATLAKMGRDDDVSMVFFEKCELMNCNIGDIVS